MTTKPTKILVVDDDQKILKALDQALRKEGYDVCKASDGEAALQVAQEAQPDLIVLDIMLPRLDGFEVCAKLRAISNVPVLILSARSEEMDKVVGFNVGADDYLTKPFRLSELVLRVRAILRRSAPPAPGTPMEERALRFREMEINRAARTVTLGGKPADLTPKEFDLLWLLASHPGNVFSREDILNRVWRSEFTGDEAALTVCVRRLREKIERDPGHPEFVKTIWGIGYKFEA